MAYDEPLLQTLLFRYAARRLLAADSWGAPHIRVCLSFHRTPPGAGLTTPIAHVVPWFHWYAT